MQLVGMSDEFPDGTNMMFGCVSYRVKALHPQLSPVRGGKFDGFEYFVPAIDPIMAPERLDGVCPSHARKTFGLTTEAVKHLPKVLLLR